MEETNCINAQSPVPIKEDPPVIEAAHREVLGGDGDGCGGCLSVKGLCTEENNHINIQSPVPITEDPPVIEAAHREVIGGDGGCLSAKGLCTEENNHINIQSPVPIKDDPPLTEAAHREVIGGDGGGLLCAKGLCREENNDINIQSPVTIKEDPRGSEAAHQEVIGGDGGCCGGDTKMNGGGGEGLVNSSNRKRGRPRKYHDDDDRVNNGNLALADVSPPPGFSSCFLSGKRGRGRPRGTGRLQLLASIGGFAAETAGGIFIPHVIPVETGEDIVSKISAFSQKGPRAVCVLSAIGSVSSVIIRQPGSSAGLMRYEGRFEILSLSGSFTVSETSNTRRKIGTLSVSLAKPDGRVFGGGVVGCLIASGPIQLIVASFKQNISKELKLRQPTESSTCSELANMETVKYPIQIAGITDRKGDQENCTTPTSSVSEHTNEEPVTPTVTVNQQIEVITQNGVERNAFQLPECLSEQKVSSDINLSIPQI
ncbi:uncharacterized protein LOC126665153 [Mercurialis annua]|uniref:uncharacterized protein LOC126665153 n=1 Tax=Mercurialis annua TaxID=3986 RepID=UPI002160A116|nr:uncharacterized protein LOC126665153 [Mercurialis annua]